MWVIAALAAPAVVALIGKIIRPRAAMAIGGRAVVHLLVTRRWRPASCQCAAQGSLGTAAPHRRAEFSTAPTASSHGGTRAENIRQNCSFVAGESSGAFWAFAPASLAPAPLRPLAYAAATAFGDGGRDLAHAHGGHFFTDVVFAGVFTFLIVWLMHRLLYGLRPRARTVRRRHRGGDRTSRGALPPALAPPGRTARRRVRAAVRAEQRPCAIAASHYSPRAFRAICRSFFEYSNRWMPR